MKKRILSILLTVCMVFTMLPGFTMPAFAADDAITIQINGYYDTSSNSIGANGTQYSGFSLANAISKHASGIDSIKQLKITAGEVTTEDWKYLYDLIGMTNFEIDAAVTTVASMPDIPQDFGTKDPFNEYALPFLQSVSVPQEITIGNYAFCNKPSLKIISFPNVEKIGDFAFSIGQSLTTAIFPNVTTIGKSAFANCRKLTEVSFPKVTTIPEQAFEMCESLTTANIPEATTIEVAAFAFCKSLTTASFPNVTAIGPGAFTGCQNLTTASYPNVTIIPMNAFEADLNLTTVNFPEATEIGYSAFNSCEKLTTANFPEATEIGARAFADCEKLTIASAPKATEIGDIAFYNCNDITQVDFPLVTNIGESAFEYCTNLTTASFPSVTTIGGKAFTSCAALGTLKLGATPPAVGTDTFQDVPKTNPLVFLNPDGTELTGVELTTVQTAYKAGADGDTSDSLWYGWKITEGSTPTEDSTHKHCLCGGANNVGDHTNHTSVGFKEWNTNYAMPAEAGDYYLNTDVTLSSQWVVNADIGLCLNGHTITLTGNNGAVILVKDGKTLNLCECNTPASSGAITGGKGTPAVGQGSAGNGDKGGSGVYVTSKGAFNMYGGKISGNTATYEGGGVYNEGTFTMYGGKISNNTALEGAGGAGGGGVYNKGIFTIYGGNIDNNSAERDGGGVYNKQTFTMNGGIITANKTTGLMYHNQSISKWGGGVANYGTFTMKNGEISDNEAVIEGGGVYNKGSFIMENGTITRNTAEDKNPSGLGDSYGGGVANYGQFTMNGGEIISNRAIGGNSSNGTNSVCGGGVYNAGSFVMGGDSSIISNGAGSALRIGWGGGLYNMGNFTLKGGKIKGNGASGKIAGCGGGVYDGSGGSYISGAPEITDNVASGKDNYYITDGQFINCIEPLKSGASIGVKMAFSGFFTSGYSQINKDNNKVVDPTIYFTSDDPQYHVELINNEVKLVMGPAAPALKITTSNLNAAKVGGPYTQEILTSYNGIKTKTYSATGLPAGLSINASSGMITGTPAAEADKNSPYSVTVTVSDGTLSDSKTFSMTVDVSDANKTYTVTFNENGGSGTMSAQSFKAITPQDLSSNAFTRTGHTFTGWNTLKDGTGSSYKDGASYTATTNATLYAQWKEITYTVSGTVKDKDDNKVSGAAVKLMKGNLQIGATVTTDENGSFSIVNVPNGTYNLVASKDGITVTSIITVSNADMTLKSAIILPSEKTNSVLVVRPNTPQIVVGNLDGQFSKNATDNDKGVIDSDQTVVKNGGAVEIKLTAEKKDENAHKASDITATAKQDGKTIGIFIDLSVEKTVTPISGSPTPTNLTQLQDLIDVHIPLDAALQDKNGYVVYRYHGTAVDAISTVQNPAGEKIELIDNGKTLKVTVNKFSTYAIGYITPDLPPTGGGGSHSNGGGGGGSHSNPPTNDNSNTGLPYYMKSGNKIYLGYSSPISGTMKYIAPKGEVVLFQENPKNFIDVSGHWAKDNIDFVTERELFIGTEPNVFSPDVSMTRAMFATVIGRLHERSFGEISQSIEKPFTDISYDSYYTKYVIWAEKNGIVKGIGGGKFDPQRAITRQEMAMLVNNYLTFAKFNIPATQQAIIFDDESKIADWAKPATQTVQSLGIMEGMGQNLFDPQRVSTRAQVSAVLQRLISEVIS